MLDLKRFGEVEPTDLLDDPDLMLEYMETADLICSEGQEMQNLLEEALSREESYQSTIADQGLQIQSLTEKIEKLNASDMILKKNEELICENKKLKDLEMNTRKECEEAVQNCKKEIDRAVLQAKIEKEKYEDAYSRQCEMIETSAKNMVSDRIFDLERKAKQNEDRRNKYFEGVKARYYELLAGSLLLNIVVVLFGLMRTRVFMKDIATVGTGVAGVYRWIFGACNGQKLWLIVLIVGLTIAVTVGLTFLLIKLLSFLIKGVWDKYSVGFILLLQGGLIFFGDLIRSRLPVNLFLLDILLISGYTLVVKYVRIRDGEVKKRILINVITGALIIAVVVGGIGVIWRMIR